MTLPRNEILVGDCVQSMRGLPEACVQTCVTSPPYWGLRDYGIHDQPGAVGLEATLDDHLEAMVRVFREVRRVLRPDGTLWLNLGDSYAGTGQKPGVGNDPKYGAGRDGMRGKWRPGGAKPKDLMGLPWRVAFALQEDGWWLRSDTIWHKPNPMPESVQDRPTRAHEYVFLLAKRESYFYDAQAVAEPWVERANDLRRARAKHPGYLGKHAAGYGGSVKGQPVGDPNGGRNLRSVWQIPTQPFADAHFATFPEALVETCIKATTSAKGACSTCGAPIERNVPLDVPLDDATVLGAREKGTGRVKGRQRPPPQPGRPGAWSTARTTGWAPSCDCPAGGVSPCVVLDPFFGSGTTGLVAKRLGRDFIGCELNPAYVDIAHRRLSPAMNHRLDTTPWEASA